MSATRGDFYAPIREQTSAGFLWNAYAGMNVSPRITNGVLRSVLMVRGTGQVDTAEVSNRSVCRTRGVRLVALGRASDPQQCCPVGKHKLPAETAPVRRAQVEIQVGTSQVAPARTAWR